MTLSARPRPLALPSRILPSLACSIRSRPHDGLIDVLRVVEKSLLQTRLEWVGGDEDEAAQENEMGVQM